MRIEIEIPRELEQDYIKDKFAEFFGRVLADIKAGALCGRYERETAEMLIKAFDESKPAFNVEAIVTKLEKESFEENCGRAILLNDAERIVREFSPDLSKEKEDERDEI